MKICVIGQGYIGIPTAALFADNGCEVVGVDVNKNVVKSLNEFKIPIEEPGIEDIAVKSLKNGNFRVKENPEESDAYIITVPTPYVKENYECDLSYVCSACESIFPYLKDGSIVIIESTISPLSMDEVIKPLFENQGYVIGDNLFLAHCPERVLPGKILYELIYNNRIVGGISKTCAIKASEVYSIFVKGEIIQTEAKVAELSKCMENTFRDVNIALVNELVKICSEIGVNALDVIELANKHPRVNLHNPGPGVGGHCLAIDPYFIYSKSPENARIIKLARDVNSSMPDFVVNAVFKIFQNISNNNKKVTIFGVAYKGNTDDDRESPAYEVIKGLSEFYEVKIFDPHIKNPIFSDLQESIYGSDLILILTDHDEFKKIDYNSFVNKMNNPIIFDTKNILNEEDFNDGILTLINFGNLCNYL